MPNILELFYGKFNVPKGSLLSRYSIWQYVRVLVFCIYLTIINVRLSIFLSYIVCFLVSLSLTFLLKLFYTCKDLEFVLLYFLFVKGICLLS